MISSIEIIPSYKIDRAKWDACIDKAANGLVYAHTFYLDIMAKHWDGLVLNDYEAVMPLTWNKKFGIHYLYQPHFTPVSGIFGNNVSIGLIEQFLNTIPKKFRYWDFDINNNIPDRSYNEITFKKRINQTISLDATEKEIVSSYKRLAKRMLQKSREQNLQVKEKTDANTVIDFYKRNYYPYKHPGIRADDYERLKAVIAIANTKG